jgi:uncharacterized protein (DUF58 family)
VRELTIRGRCFLAAGVAAIICGIQVGEHDFVRIGLLAAAVPLLAWVLTRRTERDVWVRRTLSTTQVEAGEPAEVHLEVGSSGGRRTGLLLLEEELPPALGEPQRFALEPMGPGQQQSVRYLIRTPHRGRYPVGPVQVRVAEPTGMVDLRQTISSTGSLLVTPRTEALPRISLTGRWAGAGDDRTRDLVGSGSPDVTIREYRLGDDLRRIHWPSSARTDELMVRREEQQWQSRCTLLIDNRTVAHRGYGTGSSMERAVSVAASIGRALVALDFEVRLVTATDNGSARAWHEGSRGGTDMAEHLERLALLGMTRHEQLSTGWVDESQQGGMLLAVLGHLQTGDTELLGGLAAAGAAAYAVVLDVATWESRGGAGAAVGAGSPATGLLRSRGWKATTLARDGSLPAAWQELAR